VDLFDTQNAIVLISWGNIMKPFGYIDLAPKGTVQSYDPPEALVSNFRLFHRISDDRLVATMEVIPDSQARASIDVLKRAEKPGARRSILKAVKADSTEVPIPRSTTIAVEIPDDATMHIPFFQYANKAAYRDLELRGTPLGTVLKKTVDLNAFKPPSPEAPVPASEQREFDLKSDHPGVLFTTRRARFGKFYVGPTEDEDHGVALHGSLQEPITVDVRSGLNFRKVTLPVGYDMVFPLHEGEITFDSDTGKPQRVRHDPTQFEPITPPLDVPKTIASAVPGAPGGPPLAEPPPAPPAPFPPVPPSPAGTGEPEPPSPPGPGPSTSLPSAESLMSAAASLPPTPVAPGETPTPVTPETAVPPTPASTAPAVAPTDTNILPTPIPTYLPTDETTPAALETPPTSETPGEPPTLIPAEEEVLPPGVPRYPPTLPVAPIPGAPAVEVRGPSEEAPPMPPTVEAPGTAPPTPAAPGVPPTPAAPGVPSVVEAAPPTVEAPGAGPPGVPTEVRGPIDENLPATVVSRIADFLVPQLNLTPEDEPTVERMLRGYEPLQNLIRTFQEQHTGNQFILTLPGATAPNQWTTLPEPTPDTAVIHLVFGPYTVELQMRPVDIPAPARPTVSRAIVAKKAEFRMPPNEATRPYVLYIPDGKNTVIVARDAPFRMPPNESTHDYVKILA
jgi:hypothetical protein